MATQRELRDRMRTLLHDAGQLVCEMAEVECEAQDAAQAQPPATNSAMDATKLREAFMAGRLSQGCCIEQEQAFSEFMARRRHQ